MLHVDKVKNLRHAKELDISVMELRYYKKRRYSIGFSVVMATRLKLLGLHQLANASSYYTSSVCTTMKNKYS